MRLRLKTLIGVLIILLTLPIMASLSSFAESITYTYDSLNRVTKADYGNGKTITYTYDAAGNRLTMSVVTSIPTIVTLVSFAAKAGNDGSVKLTWETASEVNNAGFNIYRSKLRDANYKKINVKLIVTKGSETEGASYSFEDTPPSKGKYYYKLEDVEYGGKTTMHGPVKVRVRGGGSEARRR